MILPAITAAATPVCAPSEPRCPCVNPLRLPLISPSDRLWSSTRSIPRLDPLHPPLVHKRTVSLETPAIHHHNHQRTLIMQKREYNRWIDNRSVLNSSSLNQFCFRYHQVWRKPFYGSSGEREEYRKELREHLKKQMEEKCAAIKLQLTSRVKEAEHLREVDRLDLSSDRQQKVQRRGAMFIYRDENKKLMEQSWRDRALTRSQEVLRERQLLHLNPINWSGTLK
ncbi:uncharacterized protein LOC128749130 isoform X1 [Synchiropus splendidus]|uniref:uncharacterized protein LOC128749130 isoform X1 n=1 Tax=Synchiropus splendidus TaxID=270530 RepID=UPI00237ED3C3|nr:uncharacterized protein LOC128749130 isoform X1 [Synchiropus splendidus]